MPSDGDGGAVSVAVPPAGGDRSSSPRLPRLIGADDGGGEVCCHVATHRRHLRALASAREPEMACRLALLRIFRVLELVR